MYTLCKLLQLEKALSPTRATDEGILMLASSEQYENAYSPMLVTPSGISMLFMPVPENAYSPILVTLSGTAPSHPAIRRPSIFLIIQLFSE